MRAVALAALIPLATISCAWPTLNPLTLKAIAAEARGLMRSRPTKTFVVVRKDRLPPVIASLDPDFVTVSSSGVDIVTKAYSTAAGDIMSPDPRSRQPTNCSGTGTSVTAFTGSTPTDRRSPFMLEHVPHWLGNALKGVRAGADKLTIVQEGLGSFAAIDLRSPAFANGGRLPDRFTADGDGVSPPLFWSGVPVEATALALLVEDPDAPTPAPLVHAIIWGLAAEDGDLAEGAIVADGDGGAAGDVGRNSYLREGWLPPDPPTGHGEHRYAFQLFALADVGDPGATPSRSDIVAAMRGRVLAAGLLTGTYSRGEAASAGPVGAVAPA